MRPNLMAVLKFAYGFCDDVYVLGQIKKMYTQKKTCEVRSSLSETDKSDESVDENRKKNFDRKNT